MDNPYGAPRLGLGFSEEQRAALLRANRLKQELYAQQKKIQFSNLLERSSKDVDAYVESQNNVFLVTGKPGNNADSSSPLSVDRPRDAVASATNVSGALDDVDAGNDRDGMDYFMAKAFRSKAERFSGRAASSDETTDYDPTASAVARVSETLQDHLLSQLRLDGKYADLDPELRDMCLLIVDNLDVSGYLKLETVSETRRQAAPGAVAYPEEDEETTLALEKFDLTFDIDSTPEDRVNAKKALDDYFSDQATTETRQRARKEFEQIVKRRTTLEEREIAKKALDVLVESRKESDPLGALFPGEDPAKTEKALQIVQSLDPPGVGARDLRESLLLRLRPDARYEKQLRKIIGDFFDDFIKKRLGALSKKCGLSQEELMRIYAESFPFYPSPGELFSAAPTSSTRAVYPEIIVERNRNGRWIARLDESLVNVELDPEYQKMLVSKRVDKKTREYLRKQFVEAQALMDALRNRNSTLLRVAKAVVDFQETFFSEPKGEPRPLTQQQIADKLGLDASTISRACNDKWLATPRGIIPFRRLFPKAVVGEVTSSGIAEKIRRLVDAEAHDKPLSDEEIAAELLKQFDVRVSRKTVQEHRDELKIPNSRVRKRLKSQKSTS